MTIKATTTIKLRVTITRENGEVLDSVFIKAPSNDVPKGEIMLARSIVNSLENRFDSEETS
jgi:hypothetical protein